MKPFKLFFETLSNEVRWKIIHILQNGKMRATDISDELGYEQSRVSQNLKRLRTCGFVFVEKSGRERIYKLNSDTIKPLLQLMDKHIKNYCKDCVEN
ncbi:MAG: ArsR/SmtB family transcription factor [Candidatus Magasanikbacteria bacterium]